MRITCNCGTTLVKMRKSGGRVGSVRVTCNKCGKTYTIHKFGKRVANIYQRMEGQENG